MSSLTHDIDRHLVEELRLNLQIMANRNYTEDPLTSSELLVTIPREKFYHMCKLSLEALEHPHKHSDSISFGIIDGDTVELAPGEGASFDRETGKLIEKQIQQPYIPAMTHADEALEACVKPSQNPVVKNPPCQAMGEYD